MNTVPDAGVLSDRLTDLDDRAHAIDVAFASCASLDAATKAAWGAYYPAFIARSNQAHEDMASTSTMVLLPATYVGHLNRIASEETRDQITIGQFAEIANATCGASVSGSPPPPPPTPVDYLRWGTYLAVALGGLYLLGTFGPGFAGLLPAPRRGRR